MSKKSSIGTIIKAWWLLLFGKKRTEKQKKRLETCYKCNGNKPTCPLCGCAVIAMTLIDEEECLKGLW